MAKFVKVTDAIINIENIKKVYLEEINGRIWVFVVDFENKHHQIVEDEKNYDYAFETYQKIINNFEIVLNLTGETI